ncbi:substrate-binding domain-containing protein [Paraburkholderia bryophila]|uniref:Phosphate ABC transporter substrate-binding protein (PhoT family) n=1 Tax=Paraburkholderia bryophila TaxID=420952 RepID=A0A329CVZ3_9BURK|nr:substrate-binding domain-containing protein [Paraburkholderia bryophila]RAS38973.1 phosphate ABC transporter substrate-binding protein (PhoT family) [Paraburkholderia bryophila]
MKSSKRKICQILALVLSGVGASAAMAVPVVQGGGSSLVAPTIGAIGVANTEIGLFGTTEASFTYYSVGSGAGQNAFLGNQPTFFGTGVTGTVDFANSDAALSTAQITSYKSSTVGTASGPLIQIPYIVTPITIPLVNAPAVTSTATPQTTPGQAHSIALNDNDLCGIFSGKIADWNAVINPETGAAYSSVSSPIKVVYRADSSGTSELLTRHLAAVCTSANTAAGVTFVDSLTFANTTAFPSGVPANFVSATGSGGVKTALLAIQSSSGSPAAVAYLSPDYTNTFLAPSSSSASSQLQVASLYNTKNSTYYAPTSANATTALGTVTPPASKLAASNPANWVPIAGNASYLLLANPASGYPVSGTSQIILSQCYADPAVKTAVHDFLNDHFTNTTFAAVVRGNGFDTVPSGYQTAISNEFLSNAAGWNLDIGNTSVCTGSVTGR